MRQRLKSPASRLFAQPFVHAQIKENIKAPRYWPLWGESTADRWIPLTKDQLSGKSFPFDDVIMQDLLVSYTRACETSTGCLRSIYPSLGMRQLFWWRHNGPVTSQLIDPIKWPNYPLQLIGIYVYKTHTTKNPWRKDVVDRQMYNCVGCFCIYPYGLSLNGWHVLLCIANNRHGVTITTHATRRHFLIWMTTVRQPTKRRRSCV